MTLSYYGHGRTFMLIFTQIHPRYYFVILEHCTVAMNISQIQSIVPQMQIINEYA